MKNNYETWADRWPNDLLWNLNVLDISLASQLLYPLIDEMEEGEINVHQS